MEKGRIRNLVVGLVAVSLVAAACDFEEQDAESRRRAAQPETVDSCGSLLRQVKRAGRGYVEERSPDILFLPRGTNYVGSATTSEVSGASDALARVPLVFFGPGHVRGNVKVPRPATTADIAPTIAGLIGFEGAGRSDGAPLTEALTPNPATPRLVISILWDGVGDNVLNEHQRSWRFLKTLKLAGTDVPRMDIGSAPSEPPAIHTTLGTGVFPSRHGIHGARVRTGAGEHVDPFGRLDAENVRAPTLADVFDRADGNRPVTGMLGSTNSHLGMIGRGSGHPGGDADPAVLVDSSGRLRSNRSFYDVPRLGSLATLEGAAEVIDSSDGSEDGRWRGHRLADPELRNASPAQVRYQQFLLESLVRTGRFGADDTPDLLFVSFKSAEDAARRWGVTSEETADVIAAQDRALRRLVAFLDREVGERRWVISVTADHGHQPDAAESGAWAIDGSEFEADANAALDDNDDGVDLVDDVEPGGVYLNPPQMRLLDLSRDDVAGWIVGYTVADNLEEGAEVPEAWAGKEDEPLFDGAVVGSRLAATSCS
ncbi:MAG: alkaline phosphatase family protein [Actinomycetota bacterium]